MVAVKAEPKTKIAVRTIQNKFEDIEELFKQNKHSQVVDIVEMNLTTDKFLERVATSDLSPITSSLFLEVFLCSFNRLKKMLNFNKCKEFTKIFGNHEETIRNLHSITIEAI